MYPSGNNYNYNNQFPTHTNQQPGFNMPSQSNYPNQNMTGYGAPVIGFNVGQPDFNQPPAYPIAPNAPYGVNSNVPPYQQHSSNMANYGMPQTASYGMYNQLPNVANPSSFSNQVPGGHVHVNNQMYAEPYQYPGQIGGYQAPAPSSTNKVAGSNWSQGQTNQQQYSNITPYEQHGNQQISIESIGSGGEVYRGTIKPHMNFNAENDCNVLRKAMKGIGTDEKAIIECLGRRCLAQRLEIKKTFKTMFGKDLVEELKSELSGDFRRAVTESLFEQDYYDAYSLRKAMEGAGTRENILTEILISRTNQQIENIKILYKKWYNRDLEKDVVNETSGFYKRVLVSCLQANKKELNPDEIYRVQHGGYNSIINLNQARQEAQELYNAGEKKLGTDEACFIKIFALRNKYQLRATFDEYQKIVGRDIFSSIDREMSGDLASALKAIAMHALNAPQYFASRLHKAMKGAGTNDNTLIRILLTRSEIDLENIKLEFQKQYGKALDHFVRSDTSGDYQKFLIRFVEGN